MTSDREHIVKWVANEVMPHEAGVRAWLRRARVPADEIDDLMQEAYAKLVGLQRVDQIESPDGYFFQVVRNLLTDKLRRARVVRIETATEIDALSVCSDEPSPEQATAARRELSRVQALIQALPERCRRVFELRKVLGVPQREIARRLGISESAVENEAVRGMRLIMRALQEEGAEVRGDRVRKTNDRSRNG